MKKVLVLAVGLVMILALAACGSPTEEQPEEQIDYEIALVTDEGLIMDGGYSEVAWDAISAFGADNGKSHKYYKAAEASGEAYKNVIDDAVDRGAKIIIADGYRFEDVIYDAQNEYKDVKFMIIDAEPIDPETEEPKIAGNTAAVIFSSEEAGYMAGYAAVENGASQLGFIGEADKAAVTDYGYGFLQGANDAAANNGVRVNVRYHFCREGGERDAVVKKASKWYEEGVEVIFACGPQVEMPVIESAELNDGKVIACETDKSDMSDTILTSAIKDIGGVINDMLEVYARDKFPGGEVLEYDTSTDSIWLDMETSRFESFNGGDYKDLSKKLEDKEVTIVDSSVGGLRSLTLSNVTVSEE